MGIVDNLPRTCAKSQFEIMVPRIYEHFTGCQTVRFISDFSFSHFRWRFFLTCLFSLMFSSLLTTLTRGFPHIPNAPLSAQQQQQAQQPPQQTAIVKP